MNSFNHYLSVFLILFASQAFASENKGQHLALMVYESGFNKQLLRQGVEMNFYLKVQESAICHTVGQIMQSNELGRCTISYYASSYFDEKITVKRISDNDYQIFINNDFVVLDLDEREKRIPKVSTIGNYRLYTMLK